MPHNEQQFSDTVYCDVCNKQWDVNDIEPPKCIGEGAGREMFLETRKKLKKLCGCYK